MKTINSRNGILGICVTAMLVAILAIGFAQARPMADQHLTIGVPHAVQVADGSESNGGGKGGGGGGKGGARRSFLA